MDSGRLTVEALSIDRAEYGRNQLVMELVEIEPRQRRLGIER